MIEDVIRLGLGLERVNEPDLVDRFGEPRKIDGAVAVGPHLRRDDVVADGHAQAFELDLSFHGVVAAQDRFDRLGGSPDYVFEALEKGVQKRPDRLRLLGGEFGIDDDGVAVELEPVVRHRHQYDVVNRHAAIFDINIEISILLSLAKSGHSPKVMPAGGAPSLLPSRSLGSVMPRLLRATIANGGLL